MLQINEVVVGIESNMRKKVVERKNFILGTVFMGFVCRSICYLLILLVGLFEGLFVTLFVVSSCCTAE